MAPEVNSAKNADILPDIIGWIGGYDTITSDHEKT